MKKTHILLSLFFVVLFCFSGCGKEKYLEEDFVGLSYDEIIDKYGQFDRVDGEPYKPYFRGGYLVTPAKKGFFGTEPPEYYMIFFDENGVALGCHYEKVA